MGVILVCGRKLEYPVTLRESLNSTSKAPKPEIKPITTFVFHFTSVQFLHFWWSVCLFFSPWLHATQKCNTALVLEFYPPECGNRNKHNAAVWICVPGSNLGILYHTGCYIQTRQVRQTTNFGMKTTLKCYQRFKWHSSVWTILTWPSVRNIKCYAAMQEQECHSCDNSNIWLQRIKASLGYVEGSVVCFQSDGHCWTRVGFWTTPEVLWLRNLQHPCHFLFLFRISMLLIRSAFL